MRSLVAFAEARSLRIAALGVSESGRALLEQAGLRALYLGDEAIVDTDVVLARRPGHPEGAPVGLAAREGRATPCASRSSRRSTTERSRSSSRSRRAGAAAARSAASAWRWTRCATRTAPTPWSSYAVDDDGRGRRVPAVRADLRPRRRLAVVHAPPAGRAERADRVHGRQGDRGDARRAASARCR